MKKMHAMGAAIMLALGSAGNAYGADILIGTVIVPAGSSTGVSEVLGPISDGDTLFFDVSGTPYLQPGTSYGTNAAGVVTVYGQQTATPVGSATANTTEGLGFTYGALIATLNGVSRQIFAPTVDNGFGSANPPATLTFSGTVASLFGANVAAAANTLTFRVDDSNYDDNSGGFTVSGGAPAAVPEPASWALMIGGFGMVGAGLRQRRRAVVRLGA